jgi:catechol 2,3-dioxygenase-like lactoylglutathione lyase family enzyme
MNGERDEMALELYMLGLIIEDMSKSLEFYRRLGLDIPKGSEAKTHVQVKMGSGLTFFLESDPSRWNAEFVRKHRPGLAETSDGYRSVLEFYLKTQNAVETKYADLTGVGYHGRRAPYKTTFAMCFALIDDPDGNTILLSGDVDKNESSKSR